MTTRPFPAATLHGELEEVFPDVFFVTGSVKLPPMPVRFSRNMTVVRDGEALTLINTVRLDDAGLAALDKLGKVEHVIRIAGFHGMDDPFYKDRYDAKVWTVGGQPYVGGFDIAKGKTETYFDGDAALEPGDDLPIPDAQLYSFGTKPAEGVIVLERSGGIAVTGDALQNWSQTNRYFSLLGKVMMRLMGFIKAHNLGPGWIKATKPTTSALRGVLDLKFEHMLPAHGDKVIGEAREKFRAAIEGYAPN